jgi:hypothetical protein
MLTEDQRDATTGRVPDEPTIHVQDSDERSEQDDAELHATHEDASRALRHHPVRIVGPTHNGIEKSAKDSCAQPAVIERDTPSATAVYYRYARIRIIIELVSGRTLQTHIDGLGLPGEATLNDVRNALLSSPIASGDFDIFFPSWTRVIYVTRRAEGDAVVHCVDSDARLNQLLAEERKEPGTIAVRLEQCRNSKYSRFRIAGERNTRRSSAGLIRTHIMCPYIAPIVTIHPPPHMFDPHSQQQFPSFYFGHGQVAAQVGYFLPIFAPNNVLPYPWIYRHY